MLDISFIKEFHFNLGTLHIDFAKEKDRSAFGTLIVVIGFILIISTATPILSYFPKLIGDVVLSAGLVLFVGGLFFMKMTENLNTK